MKKERESLLRSKKIVLRKRQKRLRIGFIVFGIVLILLVLPPLVVRIPSLAIKTININGAKTVDANTVSELVKNNLSESFLKFFPRGTFLTAGKSRVKTNILKTFPAILDAKLSFHTPNTILVEIKEREAFVLWCAGTDYKKCYFADKEGFIYGKAPEFSSPVYVVFRNGPNSDNPIGQNIVDKDIFQRINNLENNFSVLSLKTKEISLEQNEVVNFKLSHGSLNVSLRGDDKLTFDNLSSLLLNPKTDLRDGSGGIKNSYIDLRFGNKIFYK